MSYKNPYCGKPAYIHASDTPQCVKKPCELQGAPPDPEPDEEVDTPTVRPECVNMVYSSNSDEVLQQLTYDAGSDKYNAPNGDSILWDSTLGWIYQTGNGSYYKESSSDTSPFGMFTRNSTGDVISVVSC